MWWSKAGKPNLMRAEKHGYAITLSLQSMTKEDLISAIQKAMNDEAMQGSMKKMHDLFTGGYLLTVTFFMKYCIKHTLIQ